MQASCCLRAALARAERGQLLTFEGLRRTLTFTKSKAKGHGKGDRNFKASKALRNFTDANNGLSKGRSYWPEIRQVF